MKAIASLPLSFRALRLHALSGRMGGEWERERRDTLFLMGAIGLSALPQFVSLPLWASAAFVLMFCWRLALLLSGRPLPPAWVRIIGAAACFGAVALQYSSLIGRDQAVVLLTLFLGLKLLEMKARRDLFVVLFLCFLLLLTSFFGSQSVFVAALCLIAVVGLLAAMITMQYVGREASIARRLRQSALIVLQAAPLALALFVLFPRLAQPLWGVPGGGASASTGLSDSMTPGAVTDLAKSGAIAFRVDFDGNAPAPADLYWRGPVFSQYDGQRWTSLHAATLIRTTDIEFSGAPITYSVTLEPNSNRWLLALDLPASVEGLPGGQVSINASLTPTWSRPIGSRIRYQAQSYLNFRASPRDSGHMQPWLRLPVGFNPRTLALAKQWMSLYPNETTRQRVDRALAMFRSQQFHYTLRPPLLGQHTADDFLFESQAGFCEHYSSAFVILMRAMGIPARVVTGYQGGKRNPIDGYYVVRQSDAHAWAEVWSEARGWERVDPTAAVAPERVESDRRLESDTESGFIGGILETGALGDFWSELKVNLDALTHRWNLLVLNFDRSSQVRLLDRLGFSGKDWRTLAALLTAAMIVLIGVSALIALRPRHQKDPVGDTYRSFCAKLESIGLSRDTHETAERFYTRISTALAPGARDEARLITNLYNRLRYGELSNPRSVRERRNQNIGQRQNARETRKIIQANEGLRRLRLAVRNFQPGNTPVDR